MSMNIENLNIYTNGQEDLFGDGSVPEDTEGMFPEDIPEGERCLRNRKKTDPSAQTPSGKL